MPGDVTQDLSVGFCGKLPARGDFVRSGLPRDFVDAWDDWLSGVLAETRLQAGDAWLPAFLEAPVWRFVLPPGMCGAGAVMGLIMPSVDRAGRYFPLTFAAVSKSGGFLRTARGDAWLDGCEEAGRAALEHDIGPTSITNMIGIPDPSATVTGTAEWWSEGSLRVQATAMTLEALPDALVFGAMLGTGAQDMDAQELNSG